MRVALRGNPTDEEAVAVALAVDAALRADAAAHAAPPPASGWIRAARLEGIGHPPIAGPGDLDHR